MEVEHFIMETGESGYDINIVADDIDESDTV